MIEKLEVTDPSNTFISWWEKVPALAKPRTFEFKPGLNILWGKNGSGKSTIIKLLARMFHCEASGSPVITENSIQELVDPFRYARQGDKKTLSKVKDAIKINHDGQPVRCFDPSVAAGLIGGMAAFDWDFGMEGIQNTLFRGSSGQTTMFRFDKLIREISRTRLLN